MRSLDHHVPGPPRLVAGVLREAAPAVAAVTRVGARLEVPVRLLVAGDEAEIVLAGGLLRCRTRITRAGTTGLVSELAARTGGTRIDPRIAFLTCDDRPAPTPFARTMQVIDSRPWDQKRLPSLLRSLDVGAVDVRRRGLAGDVDALARKLRGAGSRRATVVMTRAEDRPWCLVCVDA